ncbi:nucleotidyltransferase family protein [Aestuariivivens insulae]|uniref:nucleotidyltransferase family protein n=1 Tax=Aestuariivivens insulae TaxID=1621988 RepID=UPI001F57FE81|nr:nucleotidyltransferase family protein [Aestuariivivens insulae]
MLSTESSNIALVILAAGASTRMGTPKQLLQWGEYSLILHTIKTALKTKSKEIIVVLGANYAIIKKEIEHLPITILDHKQWAQGLASSIAFASNYVKQQTIKPDGLLITLADQPLVSSEYLNTLISNFSTGKKQIIATFYQNGTQGVPVLFDASYLVQLSQLKGDLGAKALLKKNQVFVKILNCAFKNVDLDTLEDYKNLHTQNFK